MHTLCAGIMYRFSIAVERNLDGRHSFLVSFAYLLVRVGGSSVFPFCIYTIFHMYIYLANCKTLRLPISKTMSWFGSMITYMYSLTASGLATLSHSIPDQ
jgi:hypothetical protein